MKSATQAFIQNIVSAHENPCALNVKKMFDKQKDIYSVIFGFRKVQSIGKKQKKMNETVRIIGIDPGLRRTGWGVIEKIGSVLRFIASGTVQSNGKNDLATRLYQLHQGLSDVLALWQPQEAAVEITFVNKDATATLKLGQARAVALLVPAQAGLVIAEYAPNTIKKAVIGAGHGEKGQIHMMVKMLMPRAKFDTDDAADALAIAICHAHSRLSTTQLNRMTIAV